MNFLQRLTVDLPCEDKTMPEVSSNQGHLTFWNREYNFFPGQKRNPRLHALTKEPRNVFKNRTCPTLTMLPEGMDIWILSHVVKDFCFSTYSARAWLLCFVSGVSRKGIGEERGGFGTTHLSNFRPLGAIRSGAFVLNYAAHSARGSSSAGLLLIEARRADSAATLSTPVCTGRKISGKTLQNPDQKGLFWI